MLCWCSYGVPHNRPSLSGGDRAVAGMNHCCYCLMASGRGVGAGCMVCFDVLAELWDAGVHLAARLWWVAARFVVVCPVLRWLARWYWRIFHFDGGTGHWDINLWGFITFLIIFNLFGNSLVSVVYTIFISNNRASFHLWWKQNFLKHQKVSKYYEKIVCKIFFCFLCLYWQLILLKTIIFRLEFTLSL